MSGEVEAESDPVAGVNVDHHGSRGWYVWRDIGNRFEFMSSDGRWCEKMKEAPHYRGGDYFNTGEDAMQAVAKLKRQPTIDQIPVSR